MHDHTSASTCIYCSVKHVGAAKVKVGEGLASTNPERRRSRLLEATFELNEAEVSHLSDYPEAAQKIRDTRKRLEEAAYSGGKFDAAEIGGIIDHLVALEQRERGKQPKAKTSFTPDEALTKVLHASPKNVLKAIDHYKGDYGAAASLSDIQFLLTIPHASKLDKQIDKAFEKVPMAEIKSTVSVLEKDGLVDRADTGGYLLTPEGRAELGFTDKNTQDFNIRNPNNNMKMLKGSDVGLIVGSTLAGKGTEALGTWADQTYGLSTAPLHNRISTWLPVIGAALVLAASQTKYFKKESHKEAQMAAVVYGSHLLAQGVDVVQQVTAPGAVFGLVDVSSYVPQPGLTPAPTPGYLRPEGYGRVRDLF